MSTADGVLAAGDLFGSPDDTLQVIEVASDYFHSVAASAAIMRGDPTLMRKMLYELVREPQR
jgi:hypothetical protein